MGKTTLVRQVMEAMNLPATTISDANTRNRTIADVVRTWRRADTPAANAFVQASPVLSPELKQRLLR